MIIQKKTVRLCYSLSRQYLKSQPIKHNDMENPDWVDKILEIIDKAEEEKKKSKKKREPKNAN